MPAHKPHHVSKKASRKQVHELQAIVNAMQVQVDGAAAEIQQLTQLVGQFALQRQQQQQQQRKRQQSLDEHEMDMDLDTQRWQLHAQVEHERRQFEREQRQQQCQYQEGLDQYQEGRAPLPPVPLRF